MGFRTSVGLAFGASLLIAPPVGLAIGLAIQERNSMAIFDSSADSGATVLILLLSYATTLFGLIVVGLPVTAMLEKDGGNSLVKKGLAILSVGFLLGAGVTNDLGQTALLTAGLSSSIFAVVYVLLGKMPRQEAELQKLD